MRIASSDFNFLDDEIQNNKNSKICRNLKYKNESLCELGTFEDNRNTKVFIDLG